MWRWQALALCRQGQLWRTSGRVDAPCSKAQTRTKEAGLAPCYREVGLITLARFYLDIALQEFLCQ